MRSQQLLVVLSAVLLVLGQAADDAAPLQSQSLQMWREAEPDVTNGGREADSVPSESQDTNSHHENHPNNGPLLEETERPRPRNRSRGNGKRRRRMRKRPRTTTLAPLVDGSWEEQMDELVYKARYTPERHHSVDELPERIPPEEEVIVQPRKRPNKRRRRPAKRPTEEPPPEDFPSDTSRVEPQRSETDSYRERPENTGQRKRRKGSGRKRIRIDAAITEGSSSETTPSDVSTESVKVNNEKSKDTDSKTNDDTQIMNVTAVTETPEQNEQYITEKQTFTSLKYDTDTNMPENKTTYFQNESTENMNDSHPQLPNSTSAENTEPVIFYSTTSSTTTTTHTSPTSFQTYAVQEETDESLITSLGTTQTPKTPARYSSKTKHNRHRNNTSSDFLKVPTTTEYVINKVIEEKTSTEVTTTKEPKILVDRKALFSSSRRLPQTSAIIRRRLRQKFNKTTENDTEDEQIKPVHINTEKDYKVKYHSIVTHKSDTTKNEIEPSTLLPTGFKTNPEILSPIKLLEEVTIGEVLKMMSTTESSDGMNSTETMNGTILNLEGIELPNIRDEILDLIKSESGSSRLKRILEIRNMTLTDLLEHRERGSSQLHFSEAFNKDTASTTETNDEIRTEVKNEGPEEIEPKPEPDQKQDESKQDVIVNVEASVIPVPINEPTHTSYIQFPEQGVLRTFPTFLTDTLKNEKPKENKPSLPTTKNYQFQLDSNEKQIYERRKPHFTSSIKPISLSTIKSNFYSESEEEKREPRLFDSMPSFSSNRTLMKKNKTSQISWKAPSYNADTVKPFRGESKELIIAVTSTRRPKIDVDEVILFNENDDIQRSRNNAAGKISAESDGNTKNEDYSDIRKFPPGVKSAILASCAILGLAILGFLTVLVSCRLRQRNARLRARQDILCEQLQEDFRSSQCSLSPVLSKNHRAPVFRHNIHSNTSSNRHYYLWRTLRKTFQYE